MDPSTTSGAAVSLIGVSVVFLALVALLVIVSVGSRLLNPRKPSLTATTPSEPVAPGAADLAPAASDIGRSREGAALAAYAYHRRRSTHIRTAPTPSHWEIAGRVRQLARSEHRN